MSTARDSLQNELNLLSKEIDALQRSIFNLVAIQDHIRCALEKMEQPSRKGLVQELFEDQKHLSIKPCADLLK